MQNRSEDSSQKINAAKILSKAESCYSGVLEVCDACAEKLYEMVNVPEYRALFKELLDKERLGKDEEP